MNFHIYHPEDALRPFVKQYYYWEDNTRGVIQLPQSLFALGDQYMVFIHEGEATVKPAHHKPFTLPANAVIGQFTCACQLHVKGPVKIVIVQLNAYGCYRLTGLDMHAFTNYYRNLAMHSNPLWIQLSAKLAAARQPDEIIPVLNQAYQQALSQEPRSLKQVDEMADYLIAKQGNVSLGELAHIFHLSRPTMERIFTAVIGIPPQLYIRMVRFKIALRSLQQLNLPQWQANMGRSSYYNQAMFVKDYLLFNGDTPSYFEPISTTIAHIHQGNRLQIAVAS
ncbi:helix-turn-helix domain-containing protein [Chitinophaga vietnamensis]|uniref:helix-turn-helix domain-containing protein n=1 Tax=Chitinophaga vietnamensis TaxID=2593957 RepID=UPI001177E9DD|nr:helix-turn-helix domain-containing protein [Chitinophaga vietnamensis]